MFDFKETKVFIENKYTNSNKGIFLLTLIQKELEKLICHFDDNSNQRASTKYKKYQSGL